MAKTSNGTLKLIGSLILIGGFVVTVSTILVKTTWQAAALSKTVEQNCMEDKRVHPMAEKSKDSIIEIQKDIGQTQKDIAQIVKGQETIQKKLDDLFMMQIIGPGSNPERPPR